MRGLIAVMLGLAACGGGSFDAKETGEVHTTPGTTNTPSTADTDDPVDTEDTAPDLDPDDDGLLTEDELALGTDPADPDTDGDGQGDGDEVDAGTDPLNMYSRTYAGGYSIGDCAVADLPTSGGPSAATYQLGDTALNFALADQYGEMVDLYSFCGQTVILTFGATWCEACRYDAEKKQALMDEFGGDGLQILEVLIDNYADTELAEAWADAYGLHTVAVLADAATAETSVWETYEGDPYIPSNFVIGPDLTVIGWEVFNPNPADWLP